MIPDTFHFIFGLKPQTEPFHVAWYLCLRSCIEVNRPSRVILYYQHQPWGQWWERIRPELELVELGDIDFGLDDDLYTRHSEGRFIQRMGYEYAHKADLLRLQLLHQQGGVYADMDTLFVKPYPQYFYSARCILGRELPEDDRETLCNAVIMARPGSPFINIWRKRTPRVFDGSWNRHSCREAAILAQSYPDEVTIMPRTAFCHFGCTTPEFTALLATTAEVPEDLYSIHLWSHLWWAPERNDFIRFHAGMLTPDFIKSVDTTFNLIARQYLD